MEMRELAEDFAQAWRGLWRSPAATVAAVLTLALGLGINSAIYSIVDAALLRPLPFRDADRLVRLWARYDRLGLLKGKLSEPEVVDFAGQKKIFRDFAAFTTRQINLTGTGEPEQLTAARVAGDFFPLLGVAALRGRTLLPEDAEQGHGRVVALSQRFWERRFGADPTIVGRDIQLNGESYTVAGVLPYRFRFPEEAEIWIPLILDPAHGYPRGAHYLSAVARLAPGVSPEQARAEIAAVSRHLAEEYPTFYQPGDGWTMSFLSLREDQVGDLRPALLLLLAAGGLVLLIACVNVANLRLTRARRQKRELAIRLALGAGRMSIVRALLAESLLLSLVGGGLGLLLAWWADQTLLKELPSALSRFGEVGPNLRVLAYTLGITVLGGLLVGLIPAFQMLHRDVRDAMAEAGGKTTGGASSGRLRALLVVSETALALLVVLGAGLLVKNLRLLGGVSPGFNPSNLLTVTVSLPSSRYHEDPQIVEFYRRALERLTNVPGVQGVGAISHLPLSGNEYSGDFSLEGVPRLPGDAGYEASRRSIDAGYFRTMGIPLLAGRPFSALDHAQAPPVVVVDQTLAERFWPHASPLGKRLKLGKADADEPWRTIVGVVGHVKDKALDVESLGQIYFPYPQYPRREMTLLLRAPRAERFGPVAVRQIEAIDRDQPVSSLRTMEDWLGLSLFRQRLSTLLLAVFALLALSLSMIGIYGVLSSITAERSREVGIRFALGAQPGGVVRLLVVHGITLAGSGIGLGVVAALLVAPILKSQLYGLSPRDPAIFAGGALLVIAVAALACYVPARRAARVDPIIALRNE